MTLKDLLGLGPWTWVIAGLVLAAAETLMPGAFLIWLGLAAIATGIVDAIHPLTLTADFIVFPAFIVLFCYFGRKLYGGREKAADAPFLNQRLESLIGREFTLDRPIEQGAGRIRVDDTVWRVAGTDAPAGTHVRVTGAAGGAVLKVERV
jgi:membrane protein implicated in regulation of membrane protease activity